LLDYALGCKQSKILLGHRTFFKPHNLSTPTPARYSILAQKFRQLGDVGGDAPPLRPCSDVVMEARLDLSRHAK